MTGDQTTTFLLPLLHFHPVLFLPQNSLWISKLLQSYHKHIPRSPNIFFESLAEKCAAQFSPVRIHHCLCCLFLVVVLIFFFYVDLPLRPSLHDMIQRHSATGCNMFWLLSPSEIYSNYVKRKKNTFVKKLRDSLRSIEINTGMT